MLKHTYVSLASRYSPTDLLAYKDSDSAWISLLQSNATYAWTGASDLTLATWTDVKAGVVATAGGSGTSIGMLAGKQTAVFNGSGAYVSSALGVMVQPFAIVSVHARSGAIGGTGQIVYSGAGGSNRPYLEHAATTNEIKGNAGSTLLTGITTNGPFVTRFVINGASSVLVINGASTAGNAGASAMGVAFGIGEYLGGSRFIGSIADVIIVAGADYVARAAVIEAAALARYGL